MRGACTLALTFSMAASWPAWPHAGSNAFLFVEARETRIQARLDLALRDLDDRLHLDVDGDGRVTWREVEAARVAITDFATGHLHVGSRGGECARPATAGPMRAIEHGDGWYVVLDVEARCDEAGPRTLAWSGIFDQDASHRMQVRWQDGAGIGSTVLSPGTRSFVLDDVARPLPALQAFWRYLVEGLVHVLGGLDHLLFLAGLFLPVALERTRAGWKPVPTRRAAFARAVLIVTAFTAAHALSLCLVALGTIQPSSRVVESLVGLSVAFAGFNNLVPLVHHRRLAWLAGAFGLVHGAAIGGALLDLGLPATARVFALLSFNVGVELAQLLPIALAVVVTFAFRERAGYRRFVLVPGSLLVTLAGLTWFVWRAFALPTPIG